MGATLALGTALCLILATLTVISVRDLPTDLKSLTSQGERPRLLDRHGGVLTITFQNKWNEHDQVALHAVPPLLQQAFIIAEDKRFYEHSGVDWLARANALKQNVMALDRIRGASTITEQVVRLLHQRPRSIWRIHERPGQNVL